MFPEQSSYTAVYDAAGLLTNKVSHSAFLNKIFPLKKYNYLEVKYN